MLGTCLLGAAVALIGYLALVEQQRANEPGLRVVDYSGYDGPILVEAYRKAWPPAHRQ